jgi:hypothetical protein
MQKANANSDLNVTPQKKLSKKPSANQLKEPSLKSRTSREISKSDYVPVDAILKGGQFEKMDKKQHTNHLETQMAKELASRV